MELEMELDCQYIKYQNRLLTGYKSLALEYFKELKQTNHLF